MANNSLKRLNKLSNHLTAKVFQDPNANAMSLDAETLFNLKDKVCLVTGGSKGIGRMIAEAFVANGGKVYITSRKAELCDQVSAELNEKYKSAENAGSCHSLPGDLSKLSGVQEVVKNFYAAEPSKKLHVLINNAGASWGASYEEFPDAAWQKVMDLNVRSVFNLTQALTDALRNAQQFGDPARVVMISSVAGIEPQMTNGPNAAFSYGASKAAVKMLSDMLAKSFGKESWNITVNCVCPGVFPSNMTTHIFSSGGDDAMAQINPVKRNGRTSDMAATLLYLCGPGGAFTNGATIALDGGARLAHTLG